MFPKDFILKWKQEFNVSRFIFVGVKKYIQQIGLKYGLLFQIGKIKRTIIGETDTALKKKKKAKQSILKFEGQSELSRNYFSLEKNLFKTNFKTREKYF